MNYMDMIHDLYSGLESDSISSTLHLTRTYGLRLGSQKPSTGELEDKTLK